MTSDTDISMWSKEQADLLRRIAAGKRVDAAEIDWPHIIERVEAQGQSLGDDQLQAAQDRIAALEANVAEMKDRWMRAEAENANVRARARKDVEDARQYAAQKFAAEVVNQVAEEQDIDAAAAEAAATELLEATDRSLEAIARYGERIDARLAEIDAIRANTRVR